MKKLCCRRANRKAALGNNPVDCFNRRGFSAEKRFRPEAVTSKGCNLLHCPLVRGIVSVAIPQRTQPDICGCSSSGRAPPCQGGGSEFEPRQPLQKESTCHRQVLSFWKPWEFYYFWTAKPPKSERGYSAAARSRSQAFRICVHGAPAGRSRTKSTLDGRILY